MTSGVRVRFAPSPTGYLHVGGARTALFNWLFARKSNGVLILRIEDTDIERSSIEMTQGILDAMAWLGLDWDEGPFYQSQRMAFYKSAAEQLLTADLAYCCVCEAGNHGPACRERNLRNAEGAAVRFRVPAGPVRFGDAVYGEITIESDTIEDFVLLRTDGQPTYQISVVVDDIDMRISHVIRGADHISNTPKQILLYKALGASLPVFAHVPLILGPDKTRLSKRHGATSVISYRDEGIVPEAFRNFLALLGWTPPEPRPAGAATDILGDQQLIQLFDLSGISHSNAVFDRVKLDWFNTEYIRAYPAEKLLPLIQEEWHKAGFEPEHTEPDWLLATVSLLKARARSLKDFATSFRAFFTDTFQPDPAAVEKFLADERVRRLLVELGERYAASEEPFTEAGAERLLRDFAAEKEMKAGALINGARVVLTGQGVAPSLFAVMLALGKERTVTRLKATQELAARAMTPEV